MTGAPKWEQYRQTSGTFRILTGDTGKKTQQSSESQRSLGRDGGALAWAGVGEKEGLYPWTGGRGCAPGKAVIWSWLLLRASELR